MRLPVLVGLALALAFPGTAGAQSGPQKAPSAYDRIWQDFTQWYSDSSNPVVQRVLLSGRFHYDFAALDADQGDHDEWNVRRLRVGPRVTMFRKMTVHAEVELDPQRRDPVYVRFTDFYVAWAHSPRLVFTAGKQSVPFTLDGATSSRELLTIDRSNLANNLWFPQEYLPGFSVSGRNGAWQYRAGLYSAGAATREFGEFSGGPAALFSVGRDLSEALGVDEAVLTGSYVYQNPDEDNSFTRQLEHVTSVNIRIKQGPLGAAADWATGQGYLGQTDLSALQLIPHVDLTDRLQAVGRYTWIDGSGVNGVRLATYESRVVSGRGDRYSELYLGANYYFYGHRLKLQTGLQWADMDDAAGDGGAYSGFAWTTGLRVGW